MKKLLLVLGALLCAPGLLGQDCSSLTAVGDVTEKYEQVSCSEVSGCAVVQRYVTLDLDGEPVTFRCSKDHYLGGLTVFEWCAELPVGACVRLQGNLVAPVAVSLAPARWATAHATYGFVCDPANPRAQRCP